MGAAGNLRADNGCFRAEKVGEDAFQRIAPHIIIAIARRRSKMPVGHLLLLEGGKHPPGANFLIAVNTPENFPQLRLGCSDSFLNTHASSPFAK